MDFIDITVSSIDFQWISSILGVFMWFYVICVVLGGFHGFQAYKVWQPVAACGDGLLPLKEDSRLQSCRFGGLEAWMPGCLEAWRLEAWILEPWRLVGLLAGWLAGLDWL